METLLNKLNKIKLELIDFLNIRLSDKVNIKISCYIFDDKVLFQCILYDIVKCKHYDLRVILNSNYIKSTSTHFSSAKIGYNIIEQYQKII